MDLREGLAFQSEQFEVVYHSHVLEHLDPSEGDAFLRECYRVLQPGGILRCVVPDLEGITRAYLRQLEEASEGRPGANERHEWMIIELIDQLTRHYPGGRAFEVLASASASLRDFVKQRWGTEADAVFKATTELKTMLGLPAHRFKWKRLVSSALQFLIVKDDARRLGHYRLGGEPHRWMYDRVSLGRALKKCGFEDAAIVDAMTSAIAGWSQFGLDACSNGKVHKPDSFFMEARKPKSSRQS